MSSLMARGLELMLMGMGTVFVFLSLLVLATALMSRIANRIAPAAADAAPAAPGQAGPSDEEVAAITAAIEVHRARRG